MDHASAAHRARHGHARDGGDAVGRARHRLLSLYAALIVALIGGCGERGAGVPPPSSVGAGQKAGETPAPHGDEALSLRGEAPRQRVYAAVPRDGSAWSRDLRRGIELGTSEVARAYELVEGRFEIVDQPGEADAVIAGTGDAPRAALVLDVRETDGVLPGAWKLPGAVPLGAVAWDGRLTKYGAAQLNERYRRAFGEEMTPAAWYGWLAVKIAAEAGISDLPIERRSFDGHKGVPLRFDESRRLVHPAFRLQGGEWVAIER